MKLSVIVFRNNLRIDDNLSLQSACESSDRVLALYSLEILEGEAFGFKKCNIFREKFIKESLLNLQKNLLKFGIKLCIVNNIEKSLEKLAKEYELTIHFDEEVGTEEKDFENKLKNYSYKSFFSQTLIDIFDFDYKKSFSAFRKKAEKQNISQAINFMKKKKTVSFDSIPINIPSVQIENPNAILFKGGEDEAIKRVDYYLDFIHEYKTTRNEMSGFDNSTKFSPYLAIGCISPRRVYEKLKRKETETYESNSSYWIYFELLWRDFFHLVMKNSGNRLFLKSGLKEIDFNFKNDEKLLENFLNANTKIDIIDASIIELKTTGWLSNRNRQLVASYFVKNLGLDWRIAASFFESYLLDYNPASNYGNFAYQAHVGNDKTYRIFDPIKQSKMYNGDDYVKKWLGKDRSEAHIDYIKMAEDIKNDVFFNL